MQPINEMLPDTTKKKPVCKQSNRQQWFFFFFFSPFHFSTRNACFEKLQRFQWMEFHAFSFLRRLPKLHFSHCLLYGITNSRPRGIVSFWDEFLSLVVAWNWRKPSRNLHNNLQIEKEIESSHNSIICKSLKQLTVHCLRCITNLPVSAALQKSTALSIVCTRKNLLCLWVLRSARGAVEKNNNTNKFDSALLQRIK